MNKHRNGSAALVVVILVIIVLVIGGIWYFAPQNSGKGSDLTTAAAPVTSSTMIVMWVRIGTSSEQTFSQGAQAVSKWFLQRGFAMNGQPFVGNYLLIDGNQAQILKTFNVTVATVCGTETLPVPADLLSSVEGITLSPCTQALPN